MWRGSKWRRCANLEGGSWSRGACRKAANRQMAKNKQGTDKDKGKVASKLFT